jgi:hypothetical protein
VKISKNCQLPATTIDLFNKSASFTAATPFPRSPPSSTLLLVNSHTTTIIEIMTIPDQPTPRRNAYGVKD